MTLHPSTFEYLTPTGQQLETMAHMRAAFAQLAAQIIEHVPMGPDRTYVLRKLRETSMWVNVAITRHHDGSSRE